MTTTPTDLMRMTLAEVGYPGDAVTTAPDGAYSVNLSVVPDEVFWRANQLVNQQLGEARWCWACYRAGYDGDDCEAAAYGESDCGRSR